METRHFYKHKVTGLVAPLNDDFAAVFGDAFERISAKDAKDAPTLDSQDESPTPEAAPAAPDAPKEGDK